MNKILKQLMIVGLLFTTLTGLSCQDKNIEEYNNISQKHQENIQEAFKELNNTISYYNNKEYDKAIESAKKCEELFETTRGLSEQAQSIAQDLSDKEWLVEFKKYSIDSEKIRINQCRLLGQVSQSTKDKKNEESQELIDEIDKLNQEYNKLQTTLEDIKAQHPESFQDNK